MTHAQEAILERLRATLGDDAAQRILEGWLEDGVGEQEPQRLTAAELSRLVAWRFDPSPHRRRIAFARLKAHGYRVELSRVDPQERLEARLIREAKT